MNTELLFRYILITLFIIGVAVSIYYRRKAQITSGDEIDRRHEGVLTMIALRIGGMLTWLSILIYMIYPPLVSWASIQLPDWIRWTGVGMGVIAVSLLIWMFRSLGLNITDTVVIRKSHTLVTRGPYRWIRHPLYTFGAILFLSFSLISGNSLILVFGIPTYGILIWRTRIEESALLARFGDEYRRYAEQTGRFLPRLG
jgi:protein-S-isoprenylcysteine O-methyltransferase Ste14